ncbi:MAG TPA: ATP-grasp domain-containing protein, partial [Blastocatellia bacterium]|nr:ATP-grasp domain-containing protein [Blastocatellia bacterium]
AGYFKGNDFIRECKRQGCRIILLTRERLRDEEWPRDCLDHIITVPDRAETETYIHAVSEIARSQKPDLVVALEESDVITAARIREHLCLPGLTATEARGFRDKLWMRFKAAGAGIAQPEFVSLLNYQEVGEYLERVPPPWVVKPRADASSIGIKRLDDAEGVWRLKDRLDARESLRERSSDYLLERFITGDVFHVDSLVCDGEVVFAGADCYGSPPLKVVQEGGVSTSFTLRYDSDERRELLEINRELLAGFGLARGAAHAEFIRNALDGHFYFLEVAARVGGAYTAETLEAASGVNLWREWARIETADAEHPYQLPQARREYAGIAVSLARQESPDTAAYNDPEIACRASKPWHAGLVVRSPEYERVIELLEQYRQRFERDFTATAPQQERPE